jgi:hypothetical protein
MDLDQPPGRNFLLQLREKLPEQKRRVLVYKGRRGLGDFKLAASPRPHINVPGAQRQPQSGRTQRNAASPSWSYPKTGILL